VPRNDHTALERELDELHRVEEVLVASAIAAGEPVYRSPSAPPANDVLQFLKWSSAVGTNAAIAMKRASARSPGSSEMMKATAVPVWA
jgi:hypothetical protein